MGDILGVVNQSNFMVIGKFMRVGIIPHLSFSCFLVAVFVAISTYLFKSAH